MALIAYAGFQCIQERVICDFLVATKEATTWESRRFNATLITRVMHHADVEMAEIKLFGRRRWLIDGVLFWKMHVNLLLQFYFGLIRDLWDLWMWEQIKMIINLSVIQLNNYPRSWNFITVAVLVKHTMKSRFKYNMG